MRSHQHEALNRDSSAEALERLRAWLAKPARPDLRGLPAVSVPALGRLRAIVPEGSAYRALAVAYALALRLSQRQSLLKRSGGESLAALGQRPVAACDAHAEAVARDSGWLAGGAGTVLGLAGAAGLVADAPTLMLVALRTIIRIGYCHGETPGPALVAAVFALAAADTDDEKTQAWRAVLDAAQTDHAAPDMADVAVRDGLERAAEREFAKQALTGSLQKLTTTMVNRMGVRRLPGVLPLLGAAVGGAVNIRFVYLLGEAARMAFIARHLLRTGTPREQLLRSPAIEAAAGKSRSAPQKTAKLAVTGPARRRKAPSA
jgi:EcsC protein family